MAHAGAFGEEFTGGIFGQQAGTQFDILPRIRDQVFPWLLGVFEQPRVDVEDEA